MSTANNQPFQITELDYDSILANLRAWFISQDEFKDYDFDGAGLSILLRALAYNTHYNAFYTNMIANEGFIGSAMIPRNVYAHAKTLNYLPASRVAAQATVTLTVSSSPSYTDSSFTIPKYQQFISEALDGVSYSFVTLDAHTSTRANSSVPFIFANVVIAQGDAIVVTYNVDPASNPKLRFEVPSANVDINTLSVAIQESASNTYVTTWSLSTDIGEINANSTVYFLERGSNGNYTVYFGDGIIGKQPITGNILRLTYIVTHGEFSNKASLFTMLPLSNVSSTIVSTITEASGGSEEENITSIKKSAPIYYAAQGRATTKSDYSIILKKDFPQIGSISVWGGEENNPPIYGKVFVAISPAAGFVISDAQKDAIIKKLKEERVTLSINPEIVDPEYIYIRLKTVAEYDKTRTSLSKAAVVEGIRNTIIQYNLDNLQQFDSKFILSKLCSLIDDSNPAIIGNETKVYLEKRFTPVLGKSGTYILNFNTELKRGFILEKMGSTSFKTLDSLGIEREAYIEETPLSYTGVDGIIITNPGFGYLAPPTVSITGDGSGANAEATIVNGKVKSISVIDKGQNYTTGIVTLVATNGGSGATARPVISARYGILRTYYFDELNQKVFINEKAGSIDYTTGTVILDAFNPSNYGDFISIWIQTEDPIIESGRGSILAIDVSEASSINIDLQDS